MFYRISHRRRTDFNAVCCWDVISSGGIHVVYLLILSIASVPVQLCRRGKIWAKLSLTTTGHDRARNLCVILVIQWRDYSRFAPSQWETALFYNAVSNCLNASLESSLQCMPIMGHDWICGRKIQTARVLHYGSFKGVINKAKVQSHRVIYKLIRSIINSKSYVTIWHLHVAMARFSIRQWLNVLRHGKAWLSYNIFDWICHSVRLAYLPTISSALYFGFTMLLSLCHV